MTVAKFLPPPARLAGCLFGAIYRDTRGSNLRHKDRFNHFPASPLVTVTVLRSGVLHLLDQEKPDSIEDGSKWTMGEIIIQGPSDEPTSSWSPGDVEAVTIAIFPDAWLQMGGDQEFKHVPDGLSYAVDQLSTQDMDAAWLGFCDAASELWRTSSEQSFGVRKAIANWSRGVMARAALSGRGQSLRTFERHLKRLTGQTKRSLDFYTQFEELHLLSAGQPDAAPAEIAAAAGYADQSHMGRTVRRATGFSPAALNRAIETEEAFWCYRLLRQQY